MQASIKMSLSFLGVEGGCFFCFVFVFWWFFFGYCLLLLIWQYHHSMVFSLEY